MEQIRRREERERIRLQNEAREPAKADLLCVIKQWDDIKRIQVFSVMRRAPYRICPKPRDALLWTSLPKRVSLLASCIRYRLCWNGRGLGSACSNVQELLGAGL